MTQLPLPSLLNRLLAIVGRSFLQYLPYSRPYVPAGKESILESLTAIAADQIVLADRIAQMVTETGAPVRFGEFPMAFTSLHDLSIDYLLQLAIEFQHQDIAAIEQLVEQLQLHPAAKSLAEEALGMAKGHLDSLEELVHEYT